jgi:hypothetical protein
MIEPHSAQDGESALTEKATFVVPPKLNGIEPPFPFAFPLPLTVPFPSSTGNPVEPAGASRWASPSGVAGAVSSGAGEVAAVVGASDWRSEWLGTSVVSPSEA